MTHIEVSPEVSDELARIADRRQQHESEQAGAPSTEIIRAIEVLADNPCIGRPIAADMHELAIGRSAHGHAALYRHVAVADTVFVLAIRAQSEASHAPLQQP